MVSIIDCHITAMINMSFQSEAFLKNCSESPKHRVISFTSEKDRRGLVVQSSDIGCYGCR